MKVLVVVDMQNDFIDGTLGTPEAQAIVPKVVKKIEAFDGEVLWTQDTHSDDYLETQEGRLLPVKHCISASNGWQIHSSVKAAIQSKHPADDQLNGFEKKTFVGLCTDICVISNALLLKAFMPEVKITVDASCCAGVTPESHKTALSAMKMCQINIENEGVTA